MAVNGVSAVFSTYAQQVVSGSLPSAASKNPSAVAQQEANETAAVTQKEAQSGDRVAIQKLQRQQHSSTQSAPAEPGKGQQIDHHG